MRPILPNVLPVLFLLAACSNEGSDKDKHTADTSANTAAAAKPPENSISFTADGEAVHTKAWNINLFTFNNGEGIATNISSPREPGSKAININVNAHEAGSYSFDASPGSLQTAGKAYGEYIPVSPEGKEDHYFFRSGTVTISVIDTAAGLLQATFNGEARNEKGKTVAITEGRVTEGVIKHGVTRL